MELTSPRQLDCSQRVVLSVLVRAAMILMCFWEPPHASVLTPSRGSTSRRQRRNGVKKRMGPWRVEDSVKAAEPENGEHSGFRRGQSRLREKSARRKEGSCGAQPCAPKVRGQSRSVKALGKLLGPEHHAHDKPASHS